MSVPTPPPQLITAGLAPTIPLSRTYSFPLTPSLNSPFRAHRTKHQQPSASGSTRPKPYHRPHSEFQCHAAGPVVVGTAESSPISPVYTHKSHQQYHHPHLTSAAHRCSKRRPDSRTAALARSQSLLNGDLHQHHHLQQPTPSLEEQANGGRQVVWNYDVSTERMDAMPVSLPYSASSSQQQQRQHNSDCLSASPQALTIPIFAPENQAPPPPLVFPTEYIEEHVAKYLGNDSIPHAPPIGQYVPGSFESFSWPPPLSACSSQSSCISRQPTLIDTLSACSDRSFSSYLPTPASSFGVFPYVSTYVPASTASTNFSHSCPYRSSSVASTIVGSDNGYDVKDSAPCGQKQQAKPKTMEERMAEEKRKQRYAMDLIGALTDGVDDGCGEKSANGVLTLGVVDAETAIASIHKIWPETREPDAMYMVNPVTRNGELRASMSPLQQSAAGFTSKFAHLRRDGQQQQLTPDSSPTLEVCGSARKRKHGEIAVREQVMDDSTHALKKRTVGEGQDARTVVTIPVYTSDVDPPAPIPTQGQNHTSPITLRLFVRELLRRSKTSCSTLEVALCYLDGIEDTVKKLKDCVKLGIAFGTAAMAERGPYDEGMKDEGRIIKLDEFVKMQSEEATAAAADALMMLDPEEPSWTPISPESDASGESKLGSVNHGVSGTKATKAPQPSSQVLSTHPLLDARRTFLAALVLATKFIQDKAYSNKAWAKLSGLGGREVGRCERALGGALGWRLWVGKDYDGTSVRGHSRPTTPTAGESVPTTLDSDADSVVHGEDDLVAEAFMAEAMAAQANAVTTTMDTEVMVIPAPVLLAPAQATNLVATRAGCGRARTWPSLAVDTSMYANTNCANVTAFVPGPLSPPPATASQYLSEQFASAINLQSASTSGPLESRGSWLDHFLNIQGGIEGQQQQQACDGHQPSTGIVPQHASSNVFSLIHHSPLPLDPSNSSFDGVKTEPATPATVRITVDDVDATAPGESTPLATPYLAMSGSFGYTDSTPPTNFIEPWQSMSTYPFTFNPATQQQQQWPATAQAAQQQQQPSL
ncbi:hypothetical protein FRB95_007642, partial [Tulasnella sp. JGI-2019a]